MISKHIKNVKQDVLKVRLKSFNQAFMKMGDEQNMVFQCKMCYFLGGKFPTFVKYFTKR